MKFYKCKICKNIFEVIQDSNINPVCCGKNMEIITPNTVEGAGEKHLPVCEIKNNVLFIQIGEILHPSEINHYIQWIEVVTDKKSLRKMLKYTDEPKVAFELQIGENILEIYAYCNLHGLWMKKL